MAETWLAKLKALEAHVAVLQGTRAHFQGPRVI